MTFLVRALTSLLLALLILLAGFLIHLWRNPPEAYDRARWVESVAARAKMRPAVEARLRPGLTKEEVVDLIGLPDERRGEDEYVYDAGSGGPTPYSDRLAIRFDAQGRLETWRIERPDPTLS